MIKKLLRSVALLLVAAVTLTLTSCSNDGALIQSAIPGTSKAVASVNFNKFTKAMGWTVKDGKIDLPADQAPYFKGATDLLTRMGELSQSIDHEHVYMVVASNTEPYMIFEAKDLDAFKATLTSRMGFRKEEVDSPFSEAYVSADGKSLLLRDNLCWLLKGSVEAASEFVAAELQVAEKSNFDGVKGVSDMLSDGDDLIKVAFSVKALAELTGTDPEMLPGSMTYIAGNVDEKENSLVFTSTTYDDNGNPVEAKGMQAIDPQFLRYVPASCNFGFAAGLTSKFDWKPLFSTISRSAGFQGAAVVEVLKPYLTSIDGTVALCGSFPTKEALDAAQRGNTSGLNFVLFAKMDQKKVNEAVDKVSALLKQLNIPTQQFSNGTYSVTSGDMNLYYGSVNGAFALSTEALKGNQSNELAPIFKGQLCAGFVYLPVPSELGLPLSTGFNITTQSGKIEGKLRITPADSEAPVLPTILKELALL